MNITEIYCDVTDHVPLVLKPAFPKRVSYNRFIELAQAVLIPLCAYLYTRRVTSRGIALVDSTPIRVCHNRRISGHRMLRKVKTQSVGSMALSCIGLLMIEGDDSR